MSMTAQTESMRVLLAPAEEPEPTPCQTSPVPDRWFSTLKDDIAAALDGCAQCPVQDACLRAAMDIEGGARGASKNGGRYGVWGGTTPDMRARIARTGRARRAAGPEVAGVRA